MKTGRFKPALILFSALFSICSVLSPAPLAAGQTAHPLGGMKDSLCMFFTPVEGEVLSAADGTISVSASDASVLKEGMRLRVFRKGAIFRHPVTKEPLEKLEEPVGKAEVEVIKDPSGHTILKLVEGSAAEGDVVRISRGKSRLLFYQLKGVSWGLAEEYFALLKASGRFELLTTSKDAEDDALPEAQRLKADAVVVISQSQQPGDGKTILKQRLLWMPDGKEAFESGTPVEREHMREFTFGDRFFATKSEVTVSYKVPYGALHVSTADVAGDGERRLLLTTGNKIRLYNVRPFALEPALEGVEIKVRASDEILRLDAADVDSDGREDVIVCSKNDDLIFTTIYSYKADKFIELWRGNLFVRPIEGNLYAQRHSASEGYKGEVFRVSFESGTLKEREEEKLRLPKGVNIFDFGFLATPGGRHIIAYDGDGYLNLYDQNGLHLWRSARDYGGFITSFKKQSPGPMIERGKWSMKDKIHVIGPDALVIKREPLLEMAQGVGYKSSAIRVLRWNGLTVDELVFVENLSGTIFDYAVSADKNLLVLTSPVFGLELKKLLQGSSPLNRMLYLYSLEEQ